MPRLRSLSGPEIVSILTRFGFEVQRIKGSHFIMRRIEDGVRQTLTVPNHGKQKLTTGMVRTLYRQACYYIPETELYSYFHAE